MKTINSLTIFTAIILFSLPVTTEAAAKFTPKENMRKKVLGASIEKNKADKLALCTRISAIKANEQIDTKQLTQTALRKEADLLASLEKKWSAQDQKIAKDREEQDAKIKQQQIKSTLTGDGKKAADTLAATVMSINRTRREKIDAEIAKYRTGVRNLLTQRGRAVEEAANDYAATVASTINSAEGVCKKIPKQETNSDSIKEQVKNAWEIFKSKRQNTGEIQSSIAKLAAEEKKSIQLIEAQSKKALLEARVVFKTSIDRIAK